MTITPLPPAPNRTDPATFSDRADNFVAALPGFVSEANSQAVVVNQDAENAGTSASNASNSATASANSATASQNSATSSANSATASANSATASASSATAADTSADEAAASAASINPNSIDINGGTIDGTVIGGSTPAAISGTTGSFSGNLTVDTNTLFVNAANNRVGIGVSSPTEKLTVSGNINFSEIDSKVYFRNDTSRVVGIENEHVSPNSDLNIFARGIGGGWAGNIKFYTSNDSATLTERLRITSTGSVGIGTSSPADFGNTSKLVVQTASSTDGLVATFANSGSTGAGIQFFQNGVDIATIGMPAGSAGIVFKPSGGTERLRIDASGNLLVGTTTPFAKFAVNGSAFVGSGNDLQLGNVNNNNSASIGSDSTNTSAALVFKTAAAGIARAERMRIDASGNVGIGVFTFGGPSTLLHIRADFGNLLRLQGNGVGAGQQVSISLLGSRNDTTGLRIQHNGTTGSGIGTNNTLIFNESDGNMLFGTNNTERARIDASGNLLVATTARRTDEKVVFVFNGTTGSGLNLDDSSSVGTSQAQLFHRNGGLVGTITTSLSTTAYNTSSDYRLKEDVQPMTGASDRVLALKPVNFAWKVDGTRVDGFLAHEAQAVVPEAVTGDKDGDEMQAIDQSKLVPLLTAALQEALQKIEALEARITALEA